MNEIPQCITNLVRCSISESLSRLHRGRSSPRRGRRYASDFARNGANQVRTGIVALLLQACLLAAQAQTSSPQLERLLPTDEAQKLNATFNQDGRAVVVKIQNSSALVVTGMKVSCAKRGPQRVPTKEDPYYDLPERVRTEIHTTRLLPGKATEVYLETTGQIDFCEVWDARGRAKRLWEIM